MAEKITKRSEEYSRWYTDVVQRAELADYAPVKGCMVIRPYGYSLWENIRSILDRMIKETGHENAYFPLLIPRSFFQKEAEHVEGFAPECAVVTHGGGEELQEPLYVRPTSETVIWKMASKWISSYRDLPLLINQWANVIRWEMRPRLFIRTTEFLWQEGHTAHTTAEEAQSEVMKMLEVYRTLCEEHLAMPVVVGVKTEAEKFAGAENTYTLEAMAQDLKAIQVGTSHYFAQRFAKAFDVMFLDERGNRQYVFTTSWGVTTRLIGTLVMVHGDDQGLVLPPRVAPVHVVIVPIWSGEDARHKVVEKAKALAGSLAARFRVKIDDRQGYSPGWKFNEWELRGVPVRVEIGPRDMLKEQVVLVRRDNGQKISCPWSGLGEALASLLDDVQSSLLSRAREFMMRNTRRVDAFDDFSGILESEGGFLQAHWCGDAGCEATIRTQTKATIRCIPLNREPEKGACILCARPSEGRVLFARSY